MSYKRILVFVFLFIGLSLFFSMNVNALSCPYNTKFCGEECAILTNDLMYNNPRLYNCSVNNLLTCTNIVAIYHASCHNGYPQYFQNGQLKINNSVSNYNQLNENGTTTSTTLLSPVDIKSTTGFLSFISKNLNSFIKIILAIIIIGGLVFITASKFTSSPIVLLLVAIIGIILCLILGLISSGILIIILVLLLLLGLWGIFGGSKNA